MSRWTPIPDCLPELVETGEELLGLVRIIRGARARKWRPESLTDRRLAGACDCSKRRARQLLEALEQADALRVTHPGDRNRAREVVWTILPEKQRHNGTHVNGKKSRTKKWTSPEPTKAADFNDL